MTFATILAEKRKKTNQYFFKHGNKLAFHKRKIIIEDIPELLNEEKPIFNLAHQKNIQFHNNLMFTTENKIERNKQDFLNYMNEKKFINNYRYIDNYNNINNNNYNNIYNNYRLRKNREKLRNLFLINNNNYGINNSKSIDYLNERKYIFSGKRHEITNPELFYKKTNGDFYKYRAESKKYSDYNRNIIENQIYKNNNYNNINVNPFNKGSSFDDLGRSTLIHNTILNPIPNFSYNKYFEKEILGLTNNKKNIPINY